MKDNVHCHRHRNRGRGRGGGSHGPQLCHTAHNFYSYLSAKSEAAGDLYKRATLPVAKISAMWVYTSMREGVDCNRKVHVSLITSPPNDTCIHLYPFHMTSCSSPSPYLLPLSPNHLPPPPSPSLSLSLSLPTERWRWFVW